MNHNLKVNNGTNELEVNVSLEKNIASITENVIVVGQGSTFGFHFYSRLTASGSELSIVIIHNIGDKGFYPVIFLYKIFFQ